MEQRNREVRTKRAPFVGFWHYGVVLTYFSAVAGIMGIFLSALFGPFWGVVCLFVSGICDAFDGVIANTRKNRSDADKLFGKEIDSMSDLIAFGIGPLAIGFFMGMKKWYYLLVLCVFSLCSLIRLSYYNVEEEQRISEGKGKRTSFEGLPVTNTAIVIPTFYVIATMFIHPLIPLLIMSSGYLINAFLMVFRFRMPKAGPVGVVIAILIFTAIFIPLVLIRTYICGVPFLT